MTKAQPNPKVDAFLSQTEKWRDELGKMRAIALDCGLAEDLKWGWPCYARESKNIVLIHGFKDYCAYLFFNGALLKDPAGILIQQTENVQAGRQARFTSVGEITAAEAVLKAYIQEAVAAEQAGLKVQRKTTADFPVADELRNRLDEDPALKAAFEALTPGRQRAYLLHFAAPKQSKTREARIEKCAPQILAGKGLLD
jgi:uncharacterized protein YdeI (YjbR/CyaY-like superfamily)